MGIRSQSGTLCRIVWLTLALVACGNTKRAPFEQVPAASGADSGGDAPAGEVETPASGGTGTAGSPSGVSGSHAQGGSVQTMNDGGEAGEAAGPAECIEGAACTCGDSPGILECAGADDAESGHCACPPAGTCEASRGSCFEPCGGDALGLWVLEETCFPGAETTGGCQGGAIAGSSAMSDVKVVVLENEPVDVLGSFSIDVRAQVPLACLGIESVNRCKDAEFYASPLFFGSSRPLPCEPSACGFCECAGNVGGGGGRGAPWTPGSPTLAFGSVDVPYCVEGDVMWAGGGSLASGPKAAYKFRRRSCVGKPLACAQRSSEQCAGSGDCQPGRCLPDGGDASLCAEQSYEEYCAVVSGCKWVTGGCWGTASPSCDFNYCEETPGCSWGAPTPRCGGQPSSCFQLDPADCHAPGCSMRTCDVPDGWSGIDRAPCDRLTASACSKAAGCQLIGGTCTGTTRCGIQANAAVCAMLECAVYDQLTCGGYPTTPCADLTVEDCHSQPGCRLEW